MDGYGYECWTSGVGVCLGFVGVSVVEGGREGRVLAGRREPTRANKSMKERARAEARQPEWREEGEVNTGEYESKC